MSFPDTTGGLSFKERIQDVLKEMFADPLNPALDQFKASIPGYLEVNPPTLPIEQITGFTKFLGNINTVSTAQSTTSNSYVSLSGPTLSTLESGSYLLLYGAQANPTGGNQLYASPSVNSATPSDTVAATCSTGGNVSVMSATLSSLSNPTNTVEVQYKSTAGASSQFANRFLIALKIANL